MKNTAPRRLTLVLPHPANDTRPGPVAVGERVATVLETREPSGRRGVAPWWVCVVRAGRAGHGPVVFTARTHDPNGSLYRAWRWCRDNGYAVDAIADGVQRRPPTVEERERAAEAGNPAWCARLERAGITAPARRHRRPR